MPKGDKKLTCPECGGPRAGKASAEFCSLKHCIWCECGDYRGLRMCCPTCQRLDGLHGNTWTFFEIIQLLRSSDTAMTTNEISNATNRCREAVHRTLDVMEKKGFIRYRAVGTHTGFRGQLLYWSVAV